MKHFMLKFNAGVEIGARLAYEGHYARTKQDRIYEIIKEEIVHRKELEAILHIQNERPSLIIDFSFIIIGNVINFYVNLCL